jgi:putative transposase
VHPYLLRGLEINHSNQAWQIDITHIAMEKGFMYPGGEPLTAIIDVYSRYVVGWPAPRWGVSNSLEAAASLSVLKEAICKYGKPEIVNSNQGAHGVARRFTCKEWVEYLKQQQIQISMDGKGHRGAEEPSITSSSKDCGEP